MKKGSTVSVKPSRVTYDVLEWGKLEGEEFIHSSIPYRDLMLADIMRIIFPGQHYRYKK